MPKKAQQIYLNEDLHRRLEGAYATDRRSMKRNAQGRWIHKSRSEFMADLLRQALDQDATLEGSRIVLAGRFGAKIAIKLDNLVILMQVLIDLFCTAAKITAAQKNAAFQKAAWDVGFGRRLEDLRDYYRHLAPDMSTPDTPDKTGKNPA